MTSDTAIAFENPFIHKLCLLSLVFNVKRMMLDTSRVNMQGGAVSAGHILVASGAAHQLWSLKT